MAVSKGSMLERVAMFIIVSLALILSVHHAEAKDKVIEKVEGSTWQFGWYCNKDKRKVACEQMKFLKGGKIDKKTGDCKHPNETSWVQTGNILQIKDASGNVTSDLDRLIFHTAKIDMERKANCWIGKYKHQKKDAPSKCPGELKHYVEKDGACFYKDEKGNEYLHSSKK